MNGETDFSADVGRTPAPGGVEFGAVFDDAPCGAGGLGVDGEGEFPLEIQVALDAEAEGPLEGFEFSEREAPDLRCAEAEIGEAELC